eukprot:3863325-Pleurochrysis_carterae.AAC.1
MHEHVPFTAAAGHEGNSCVPALASDFFVAYPYHYVSPLGSRCAQNQEGAVWHPLARGNKGDVRVPHRERPHLRQRPAGAQWADGPAARLDRPHAQVRLVPHGALGVPRPLWTSRARQADVPRQLHRDHGQ